MKSYLKKCLKIPKKEDILWLLIVIFVPMVTLWGLLFSPGLYAYSDQHFPLSSSLPPTFIVSTSPLNGFSFDRLFITWFIPLALTLSNSLADIERIFLYYTFLLYSLLCYAFAALAVDFYSSKINALTSFKKNAGKLAIFILAYSNLSSLNLNADGGSWADAIILILLSISIILILKDAPKLRIYLIISGFIMLSVFIDPDYLPMFWLAVFVVSLAKALTGTRELKRIAYSLFSIAVSIIPVIFLYFQAFFSAPPLSPGFNVLGYRDFSPSTVAFFSSNINPYNVFILVGHLWSTIIYAPPSILLVKNIFNLSTLYYPPQIIVVPGIIYYLWLISLGSIPVIAFSALFFRSTRKTALPVFTLLIVAYLVTQEWNFRIVYNSLHILINIPLFGTAIGTALSLPGHFINLMAYTYLPLFAMGVLTIIHNSGKIFISTEKYQKSQRRSLSISMLHVTKKRKKAQVRVLISSFVIILLVSLAGWQAFSGSYYPMRAYPGSFLLGNSIEPKGVFSPTVINASVIKAYNIVVSNSSSGYNSVWIGGPSENDFAFAGVPNSVTENSLSYLVTNHLWYDVQPYLESHSVRYVIVSNEDIAQTGPNPFLAWGFNNYSGANIFFNESGLCKVYSEGGVSVYELPKVNNPIYYSNLLLDTTGMDGESSVLYKLFSFFGYNTSFSVNGIQTGFDNSTDNVDVIEPSQFPFSSISPPALIPLGMRTNTSYYSSYDNSTLYNGHLEYSQNNSLGQYMDYLPGNFTTTSWSGNVSFSFNDGSLIAIAQNSSFSLGYNGSLAGTPGGVRVPLGNRSVAIAIDFGANVSTDFKGSPMLSIIGEASNSSAVTYFQTFPFKALNNEKRYVFNATLPINTVYLGFRIGFYGFTGIIDLPYVNFTVSDVATPFAASPFGSLVSLNNATLSVPAGFDTGYLLYSGGDNGSPVEINLVKQHNIISFSKNILGAILVRNGTMASYAGKYAVINVPISLAYHYISDGKVLQVYYIGEDGSYVYPIGLSGKLLIVLQSSIVYELEAFYSLLIALSFSLIIIGFSARDSSIRKL